MAVYKCKMCDGTLNVIAGTGVCECEYCGTKQTIPRDHDDEAANLFNRANHLRVKCDYDKAQGIYERIVTNYPEESEAYWGLVLCKYGIEYVEDPADGRKVPTCHRTLFESVQADADYKSALEYASEEQREIYKREAEKIDLLQRDILGIVRNEEPFDIFICYKETAEDGQRTNDSVLAQDMYEDLVAKGYKVFFSRITLEDKLGQAYEPYIFAALNSAKVMLVLGTKPEHFNAVWVKNEWSRYLKIIKNDRSRLLIPCYKDMDAYDLPEEFAHLQAQDMSKIGYLQDIVRGIKKVIGSPVASSRTAAAASGTAGAMADGDQASADSLQKRAFIFLEDGDWQSAFSYFEKVLDRQPENARAYMGKMMAEAGVRRESELASACVDYRNSNNYLKAMHFGDKVFTSMLESAALESAYGFGMKLKNEADSEEQFLKAAELFRSLPGYKDSEQMVNECAESAKKAKADAIKAAKEEKRKARNRAILYHIFLGFPFWFSYLICSAVGTVVDNGVELPALVVKNMVVVVSVIIGICVISNRALYQLRDASRGWNLFANFMGAGASFIAIGVILIGSSKTEDYFIAPLFFVPIGYLICSFIGNKIGEHKAYKEL